MRKMASGEQAMYISSLKHRYYSMHDLTTGVHGKLDFAIGGQKLEWYNMYVRTNSDATRYNNSVSTEYLSSQSYTQDDELRSSTQTQSIFASHLRGTHHILPDLTFDWAGIFSRAKEEEPDRTYITLTNEVQTPANGLDGSLWDGQKHCSKHAPRRWNDAFSTTRTPTGLAMPT